MTKYYSPEDESNKKTEDELIDDLDDLDMDDNENPMRDVDEVLKEAEMLLHKRKPAKKEARSKDDFDDILT